MNKTFPHRISYNVIISLSMLLMIIMSFFIQLTPEIADTPEAEMPDEEVVDTMGDDILESME